MNSANIFLGVAAAVLVVSAVVWGTSHDAASEPAPSQIHGPSVAVQDQFSPSIGPSERSADGIVGDVRLAVDGAVVTGFTTAMLFEDNDGRPHWGQWLDVSGVQVRDVLALSKWTQKREPSGTYYLDYTLRTERDERVEWVCGWAEIETVRVRTSSMLVRARPETSVEVFVKTSGGQAVPGALIAIDALPMTPIGVATHFVYTDELGRAIVRGLDRRTWFARLVDGVGPAESVVESRLEVGVDDTATLTVVGLDERLTFTRHGLVLGLPGASTRIERTQAAGQRSARVWSVSRWIGPGRGPETPLWFVRTERDALAGDESLTVVFEDRAAGSVVIPRADDPHVLTLPLDESAAPSATARRD